jgi:positive regulator of sigma E activity
MTAPRFDREPDECTTGRVVALSGERATVMATLSTCQGCGHQGSCGLFVNQETRTAVEVRNRAGARAGDVVRVAFSARDQVRTACILYLVPSISTVAGAAAGQEWLAGPLGLHPVAGGLLGALVMFLVGMLPAAVLSRRTSSLPEIVEILREESGGDS